MSALAAALGLRARQLARLWEDLRQGLPARFSTRAPLHPAELRAYAYRLEGWQPIRRTELSENKLRNLARAILALEHRPVLPGQVLSFWRLVGRPTRARGYVEGRALVAGRLRAEVGGGLCQLSGLLYHLALRAGLGILERHAHSVDLYTPETRFAPLGADATVVYGRKDLRLENRLPAPVLFRFTLEAERLQACLCCPRPLAEREIAFEEEPFAGGVRVTTYRQAPGAEEVVARSHYLRPPAGLGNEGARP